MNVPQGTPILLDEVLCLGDEESLSQCHHRDWGVTGYCNHFRDAGVVCQGMGGNTCCMYMYVYLLLMSVDELLPLTFVLFVHDNGVNM